MSAKHKPPPKPAYDCGTCPAYCCSSASPVVYVTDDDVRRAARAMGEAEVARRLDTSAPLPAGTTDAEGRAYLGHWRVEPDPLLGEGRCTWLDAETRRCGIYDARPGACRRYPWADACGFADALRHHRRISGDPEALLVLVPLTTPHTRRSLG